MARAARGDPRMTYSWHDQGHAGRTALPSDLSVPLNDLEKVMDTVMLEYGPRRVWANAYGTAAFVGFADRAAGRLAGPRFNRLSQEN